MFNLWALPFLLVVLAIIGAGLVSCALDGRDNRRARRHHRRTADWPRPTFRVIRGTQAGVGRALDVRHEEGSGGGR